MAIVVLEVRDVAVPVTAMDCPMAPAPGLDPFAMPVELCAPKLVSAPAAVLAFVPPFAMGTIPVSAMAGTFARAGAVVAPLMVAAAHSREQTTQIYMKKREI